MEYKVPLTVLKNRDVVVAPKSSLSEWLVSVLKTCVRAKVKVYVDREKRDSLTVGYDELVNFDYDYIVVISNKYNCDIVYELLNVGVPKSKIFVAINDPDSSWGISLIPAEHVEEVFVRECVVVSLLRKLKENKVSRIDRKSKRISFVSYGPVGANLKYALLSVLESKICKDYEVALLLERKDYLDIHSDYLKKLTILEYKPESIMEVSQSEVIVFDSTQLMLDKLISSLSSACFIQIWHGVPTKYMPRYEAMVYDYFVVPTQKLVPLYSKVFSVKKFVNLGYPRVDVVLNPYKFKLSKKQKELISEIERIKQAGKRILMWIPTYREILCQDEFAYNINFDEILTFCECVNAVFVVKPHPLIFDQSSWASVRHSSIYIDDNIKNRNNILVLNPLDDVYPILNFVDVLITDYSSIFADYIVLNRPVLFFPYDYEEHVKVRGEFQTDYESYVPGKVVRDTSQLLTELEKILSGKDDSAEVRREALKKFYDCLDGMACERFASLVDIIIGYE